MPQRHRPELSESVSADPLGTYRRTPRTFRPGRRCAAAGCLTVLSIYNGAKHCAAHNPKQATMPRTRVPDSAMGFARPVVDKDLGAVEGADAPPCPCGPGRRRLQTGVVNVSCDVFVTHRVARRGRPSSRPGRERRWV